MRDSEIGTVSSQYSLCIGGAFVLAVQSNASEPQSATAIGEIETLSVPDDTLTLQAELSGLRLDLALARQHGHRPFWTPRTSVRYAVARPGRRSVLIWMERRSWSGVGLKMVEIEIYMCPDVSPPHQSKGKG